MDPIFIFSNTNCKRDGVGAILWKTNHNFVGPLILINIDPLILYVFI